MATQVQFRRGTTAQNNSFTGVVGELSVNTSINALRIHDGSTSGGFELAKSNLSNISSVDVVTATTFVGALTGTASNVTTNANLTGHVTSVGNAAVLGSFTSAQLATALTDETGSGANVFATSPTLVTPALGAATATSVVVGSGVTINSSGINAAAGIITATSFVGSGANLTNLSIPASFNELDATLFS